MHVISSAANGQADANRNDPRSFYNGWSSFKLLKNKEPPLVMAYSNPLNCKLTPEVCPSTDITLMLAPDVCDGIIY